MKKLPGIGFLLVLFLAAGCADEEISRPEPVQVCLSPDSATVHANQSVWFHATVLNASDTSLVWSVGGIANGDSMLGIVSPTGRYTAPGHVPLTFAPITVGVTATSRADPTRSATAWVTVEPADGEISIDLAPCEASLKPAQTQLFQAEVDNAIDPSVAWSVDEIPGMENLGLIYGTGHYQAPEPILDELTIVVRATSSEDSSRSAAALVHLLPFPVVVNLSPELVRIGVDQRLTFDVAVENTSDTSLEWYVNGVKDGNTTLGRVNILGIYRAPASLPHPPHVEIKAVSRRDTTKFAVCQVEIVPAVKAEAEHMTRWMDRGGVPIDLFDRSESGASGGYAVEGLDRMQEWIEIPVEFEYSGEYEVAFRSASNSATKTKLVVSGAGPEGQDRDWTLNLNGGGCG